MAAEVTGVKAIGTWKNKIGLFFLKKLQEY